MKGYFKLTAALAAFALLVVVMGLSTSPQTVEAQTAPTNEVISGSGGTIYICTDKDCDLWDGTTGSDNVFGVSFTGSGTVRVQNLDLPRQTHRVEADRSSADDGDASNDIDGPDANPKTLEATTGVVLVGVKKSSGLVDASDTSVQVKAFHGNRIQVTFTPEATTGQFATIRTVVVDNVKPQIVTNSPNIPLIVSDGVNLTFSANITDADSGYTTKVGTTTGATSPDIEDQDNGAAPIPDRTTGVETNHGGIRLVVAGQQVDLGSGDFTKIDGGWRVSKLINSSAIQAISPNIPWYFETKDRAGNVRRTSGSISSSTSKPVATDETTTITTLIDTKFIGNLQTNTFAESSIRVTRKDANNNNVVSNPQPITGFSNGNGAFTFPNTAADPLFGSAQGHLIPGDTGSAVITPYRCPFDVKDIDDNGDDTIQDGEVNGARDPVDAVVDRSTTPASVTTAATLADTAQLGICGALEADGDNYKRSTYEILASNLITVDSEEPDLPVANVKTGVGYDSGKKTTKTQKNSIQVRFTDAGSATSNAPGSGIDSDTVTRSAFTVGGHTVESVLVVGNAVYLTLADNLGSTEQPSVAVASGSIKDKAGNAFVGKRVPKAVDGLGPNLSLSKSTELSNDRVTVTITTDEQLNASPTVTYNSPTNKAGDLIAGDAVSVPASSVRQATALSYTYAHSNAGQFGGKFSIHATGKDTGENSGSVGDNKSASSSKAFTFQLDKQLNKGEQPIVSVSSNKNVNTDDSDVEQVDPMIVTVDFKSEGSEYTGDSYKQVELTSAKLRVTFADGSFEDKTFNLTTEVSSPDKVKHTIPLLNPRVGSYRLTVQAKDAAGNVRRDGTGTTPEDLVAEWTVTAARPVDVELVPGWNLISLPFQPANPAINSVIPANHPVDLIMTRDNVNQIWLVSRRDAESGTFMGDIAVMTANTAYFVRTDKFEPIKLLRPALATAAAAPPPPPAITVVEGWNLVPVVSNDIPTPKAIAADAYFGTLGSGGQAGWLKALTFNTLVRTWTSVTPGDTVTLGKNGINPCTGVEVVAANVQARTEPCQIGAFDDKSTRTDDTVAGPGADGTAGNADDTVDSGGRDGYIGVFDGDDTVTIGQPVEVGKGYWLYATADGVIIP